MLCAIGDLLMDVVARPESWPTAGDDRRATITVAVGGQAANVAAWSCHLGAPARVLAVRSLEPVGELMESLLVGHGVEVIGPRIAERPGLVVALLDAEGERAMMSDRADAQDFSPHHLDPAWLEGVTRLHVTGYALLSEPIASTELVAAQSVRAQGGRVSVDLSASHLIRRAGGVMVRRRIEDVAPDIVFGTVAEFDALDGDVTAPVQVVKDGPRGCTVTWPSGKADIEAPDVSVIDTTGAGDAFAAGFLRGSTRQEAISGAIAAAGQCLQTVGAMPPRGGPDGV